MMMRGAWQSLSADGVLRVNEKDLNLIWSYTRTVEMPNATDGTTEEIEMTKTGFLLLCRLCGTDTAAPSRHVALEYVLSDLPARA